MGDGAFDARAFYGPLGGPAGGDRMVAPTIEVRSGRVHLRLSASQVETFANCERKWAWRYVAQIEAPAGPGAELGKVVHAALESYFRSGSLDFTTEVGYIAASGLEHLPPVGTFGLRIEEEFHFFGPSGHSYLGYKDLQLPPTGETPGVVIDHKTTRDLRWQKTEQDLRTDIQATLYAVDYFREYPDEQEVELHWVYYLTGSTRKSAITKIKVNQQAIWMEFQRIEKIAERMAAAALKQPLELQPNVDHCSAFGGCPYQGQCNLSPFDKVRSYVEQNRLLAKLGKSNGQVVPLATAAAAAATPTAATPPAAAGGATNALLGRLKAAGAPTAVAATTAVAAASAAPAAPAAATTAVPAAPAGPAINPPEWQPPPEPPAQPAPASPAIPDGLIEQQRAAMAAAQAAAAVPTAAAAVPAPAARGRGRPRKADVVAAQAQALAGQANPFNNPLPAAPASAAAAAQAVQPVARKIGVLYVNCGPVGIAVVDATTFIAAAKSRILQTQGLADYRFAEFGQGPGMLAIATATEIDQASSSLPHVRVDTDSPEGAAVVSELTTRAALVVRA